MARRDFQGREVVITGGGGGIGRALGARFAARGARVTLVDLDRAAAQDAAAGIEGAKALACDITDEAACAALFADREVDVLVNNAGITHRSAFADTELAVLRRVIDVNLFGAMNCTKAALPSLVARQGLIVVMSSVAGLGPLDARAGYSASKHGLHGMFETLRSELRGTGVDVLMVCPSFVATAIATKTDIATGGRPGRSVSTIGKVLSPEAVAEGIVQAGMRGKRLLLPSWTARLAYVLSRLTPRFYEGRMSAGVRDELRRREG